MTEAPAPGATTQVPEPVRLVCIKCKETMRIPASALMGPGPVNVRCPNLKCRALLTVTPKAPPPPNEVLGERDVTLERIEAILSAAYMRTERDSDGDLFVLDGAVKAYLKLDVAPTTISLLAGWPLKSRFPQAEKLAFMNALNNSCRLARFTCANPTAFYCDHHLMYGGGLTPIQLVRTVEKFMRTCHWAVTRDVTEMIGSD
jgi:Putative bacterial sensory transduction regulator